MKKRTNNNFLDQKYEKKLKHFDKKYQKLYKNREDVIVLDMTQKIEDLTKICIEKIQLIHANNINAIL